MASQVTEYVSEFLNSVSGYFQEGQLNKQVSAPKSLKQKRHSIQMVTKRKTSVLLILDKVDHKAKGRELMLAVSNSWPLNPLRQGFSVSTPRTRVGWFVWTTSPVPLPCHYYLRSPSFFSPHDTSVSGRWSQSKTHSSPGCLAAPPQVPVPLTPPCLVGVPCPQEGLG